MRLAHNRASSLGVSRRHDVWLVACPHWPVVASAGTELLCMACTRVASLCARHKHSMKVSHSMHATTRTHTHTRNAHHRICPVCDAFLIRSNKGRTRRRSSSLSDLKQGACVLLNRTEPIIIALEPSRWSSPANSRILDCVHRPTCPCAHGTPRHACMIRSIVLKKTVSDDKRCHTVRLGGEAVRDDNNRRSRPACISPRDQAPPLLHAH